MLNSQHAGYLYLSIAQASIAANVITGKHLNSLIPVYVYIGGRFFCSTLILAGLTLATQTRVHSADHPMQRLSGRDWLALWGQAATAGLLFNVLFLSGLNYTTATSAGIIASTLPGVMALLALVHLRERLAWSKVWAILMAMLGIMILGLDSQHATGGRASGSWIGDLLVFLSIIPEAYYSILAKRMQKRVTILGSAMVVNFLSLLLIAPFTIYALADVSLAELPAQVYLLTIFGGLCSVTFFLLWNRGLQVIPANTAAIFGGVLPIAATLMAALFLGESFGWFEAAGMACVFFSLWLGSDRAKNERVGAALPRNSVKSSA